MKYNYTYVKWDTFQQTLNFKDNNWNSVNLIWSTITFSVKKNINDVSFIIQRSAIITDTINWVATIMITSEDMKIDTWIYYYDIEWIDSIWFVRTFLRWAFTIIYQIT